MAEPIIVVNDLHKEFVTSQHRFSSLKQMFVAIGRRDNKSAQKVLDGVSFTVNKGEFFGIVGRNGSGKSTLLKILAGVYSAGSGGIQINGKLTPFIELGVGFNPELTGRDNVFLNGALLGFSRKQMIELYDEIVGFAELQGHMDKKLKNYSSGMQVRLAFSIAIRVKSDILLLDEVLAVGDHDFQQKCYEYFAVLKKQGQTVVLVSHDQGVVEKFCNRVILLEKGKIVAEGKPSEAYTKYLGLARADEEESEAKPTRPMQKGMAKIHNMHFSDSKGANKTTFSKADDDVVMSMEVEALSDVEKPVYGIVIYRRGDNAIITQTNTRVEGVSTPSLKQGERMLVDFKIKNIFGHGTYDVTALMAENTAGGNYYDWAEKLGTFTINREDFNYVPLFLDQKIGFRKQ